MQPLCRDFKGNFNTINSRNKFKNHLKKFERILNEFKTLFMVLMIISFKTENKVNEWLAFFKLVQIIDNKDNLYNMATNTAI